MANNFPKLKTSSHRFKNFRKCLSEKYCPKHIPRHIILKMQKIKEKEKQKIESSQGGEGVDLAQRNKDKNNSRLVIRNCADKETMSDTFKVLAGRHSTRNFIPSESVI